MKNVVIVEGVRTGFGKIGGKLRQFPMSYLAAKAIDGLLDKTHILERGGHIDRSIDLLPLFFAFSVF